MTVEEVVGRLLREKAFFERSGGGVTLSGGECLLQAEYVTELLHQCKEKQLDTAVDTCGAVPQKNISIVLPYTDLFLYDLKHMDSEKHRWGTGSDNCQILSNLRYIASSNAKVQIRIPLIPGYNSDSENIEDTISFVSGLGECVSCVQLLPYHDLGLTKWQRLSMEPPAFETSIPSDAMVKGILDKFLQAGLPAMIH